jgi:hypothetical protein
MPRASPPTFERTLSCIERIESQRVPTDLLKTVNHGTGRFVSKSQYTRISARNETLRIIQTEAKVMANNYAQTLDDIKMSSKARSKSSISLPQLYNRAIILGRLRS